MDPEQAARVKIMRNILQLRDDLYHYHHLSNEKTVDVILGALYDVYGHLFPDFDYNTLDDETKKHLKQLSPEQYTKMMSHVPEQQREQATA